MILAPLQYVMYDDVRENVGFYFHTAKRQNGVGEYEVS